MAEFLSSQIPGRQPVVEVLDDEMAAVLRQKSSIEKCQMLTEMWEGARMLLSASLRSEHPDWTPEEVQRVVASRMSHGAI